MLGSFVELSMILKMNDASKMESNLDVISVKRALGVHVNNETDCFAIDFRREMNLLRDNLEIWMNFEIFKVVLNGGGGVKSAGRG